MQLGTTNRPNQELPPMTGIRFIPAQVKTLPDERPDARKRRGSQILAQRGTADKTVTDLYDEKVSTVRYRCSDCGSAFRQRPKEIDSGGPNPADARMGCARAGARPVAALREPPYRRLRRLRIAHERMARRSGSGAERAPKTGRGARGRVRSIGEDETVVRVKGVKTVVGVVTDTDTSEILGLEALVERDADGFME